jgi:cobalamin synthase
MTAQQRHGAALRFTPLWSALIGAASGAVYWLSTQCWPANVAVVLAMLATALLRAGLEGRRGATPAALPGFMLAVLVKYNALMALSAASLPFAAPANVALGFIMIAGLASSRALAVSAAPVSHADLAFALVVGFAPAALIGLPGLVGLVAAIGARIAVVAYLKRTPQGASEAGMDVLREVTEVCFYLGALATWGYA